MNTSKLSANPQHFAPRATISTEEIKTRTEAMFADRPALDRRDAIRARKNHIAATAATSEILG